MTEPSDRKVPLSKYRPWLFAWAAQSQPYREPLGQAFIKTFWPDEVDFPELVDPVLWTAETVLDAETRIWKHHIDHGA